MANFEVKIKNFDKLSTALRDYPRISEPILQRAIDGTAAILARQTTRETVPYRTGNLLRGFTHVRGKLQAVWKPTARYAAFVNFGTRPHIIEARRARVLANKQTGQIFGKRVQHPGTQPNPYMERILLKSQNDIDMAFDVAYERIFSQLTFK